MGGQVEAEIVADTIHGELPPGHDLARVGRLSIPVPDRFELRRVALSHGWSGLDPTAYDATRNILHRTLSLPDAGPLTVAVSQPGGPGSKLALSWGRTKGTSPDRAVARKQIVHMLALDADLAPLHEVAPAWIRAVDGGRLLRSPTVWEDLAKTLATTNCSWAATRGMVRRLVATLGAEGPDGERAFPIPAAVVDAGEDHMRDVIRAGYRARSFVELAAFCDGTEQRWLAGSGLDDETVMKEMLALRGFGRYAVEGMLGLLGRPRGFAVDSWIRAVLGKDEKTIAEEYAKYGVWSGSVLWLDVTRHWFEPAPDTP
jgi:3-methyladenine DNA glycosylase/8-oxoguanine DNA glycosylase